MKKIVFGFLFVLFAFNVNAKDLYESGLDKFQNAQSIISKSTLPNNDQTDAIIAEAKQLMPDEDWTKIDAMEDDKKLIYVRNLLAVKAYETLRKEWMDDFKAQVAKRNDTVWESGDDTWKVYQRSSAKKFVIEEHEDAELHCEKTCALYDIRYHDYFNSAYFDGCLSPGKQCWNVTRIPDDWEEVWLEEECGYDDADDVGSGACSIMYVIDSVTDNTQIFLSAFMQYDKAIDDYSSEQSIIVSVAKETKKLSDERKFQNASRQDIKNGKMLDGLKNNGVYTKKWSPVSAGGRLQSKHFDFFWQKDESQN